MRDDLVRILALGLHAAVDGVPGGQAVGARLLIFCLKNAHLKTSPRQPAPSTPISSPPTPRRLPGLPARANVGVDVALKLATPTDRACNRNRPGRAFRPLGGSRHE